MQNIHICTRTEITHIYNIYLYYTHILHTYIYNIRIVKALMGPYLVFLSSTVNGYEVNLFISL